MTYNAAKNPECCCCGINNKRFKYDDYIKAVSKLTGNSVFASSVKIIA